MTRLALEPRYPCPVCLGSTMKKARLADEGRTLLLDYCARCGGIWFELGEVQLLRSHPEGSFWSRVERRVEPFRMPCHSCQAIMDRNDESCPACGWSNTINCPTCSHELIPQTHRGLRLDVCRRCKGIWFDHIELAEIWKQSFAAHALRAQPRLRSTAAAGTADVGASILFDAMIYTPDLLFSGARVAGLAIESGASALANAPEVVGGVAEAVGDAAGSVFETIAEIIGGIFS